MAKPKDGAELVGYVLGRTAAATFAAWIIITFNLPLWAAALLIFCFSGPIQ